MESQPQKPSRTSQKYAFKIGAGFAGSLIRAASTAGLSGCRSTVTNWASRANTAWNGKMVLIQLDRLHPRIDRFCGLALLPY